MYIGRNYPFVQTVLWTKYYILIFIIISTIPVGIHMFTDFPKVIVPWLPIALIGTALAFYLGFKNNASYDRLWEARRIWGGIINTSRTWAMMIRGYVREDFNMTEEAEKFQKRLINRHLAWVHTLRFQLRTKRAWEHTVNSKNVHHLPTSEERESKLHALLEQYISAEELALIAQKKNLATQLLDMQMQELTLLRKRNYIEDYRHMELGSLLKDLFDHQGGCERIKNTPFPRQYASLNVYFVWIFIILLPFGLIQEFASIGRQYVWLTIPFSVLISWVFHTMEMIGDYSENPFEGLNNDVPITSIARTIEIDLLEMMQEKNIPKPTEPIKNVLM